MEDYEAFKKDVEEGPVSSEASIQVREEGGPISIVGLEDLDEEDLEGLFGEDPVEDLGEEEVTFDTEEPLSSLEPEESIRDKLRILKEKVSAEIQRSRLEKRKAEIRKYEKEARSLQEKLSLARAHKTLRDLKGTRAQKITQKIQDVKGIFGALDTKGDAGRNLREGFKKMVPRARVGSDIYSTGASGLREMQTPRPDRSLYSVDTDRLKALSSPHRSTRISEVGSKIPKGLTSTPRIDKSMVVLGGSRLRQKPSKYYKKRVRDIKRGIV